MAKDKLFTALEHMAQGLAYWMGYRQEYYASHRLKECVAVEEAVLLLKAHLDNSQYTVECEVPYSKIDPLCTKAEFADIAISLKQGGYQCVVEFKKSDQSIKAIENDFLKLNQIKAPNIKRLEIILFQSKSPGMVKIVMKDRKYVQRVITFPGPAKSLKIKGRRLCKAWESESSIYPSVAILEVL